MHPVLAEFLGTALLVLLGDGVVANVVLERTKGNRAGWIVITLGWGMAVFVAVLVSAPHGGGHLNPAVTISLATAGKFAWDQVPLFIGGQMAGAFLGAVIVWAQYRAHFAATTDADAKLAVFCTGPAIRGRGLNLLSEIVGTFVLVFAAMSIVDPAGQFASINALPIGLTVLAIGLSLGGTTGYAINPARDLSPRLAHAMLPIAGKRDSNWSYAWIPVVGPIAGGLMAVIVYRLAVG